MSEFLRTFVGNDELYERMVKNADRPFTFFPIATYDSVNDLFDVHIKEDAHVVHPIRMGSGNLTFDVLCDFEGTIGGIRINGFKSLKLMPPELLEALDSYNMKRLWPIE